jgi:predicted TIM-barrel fold metal-dependent hydrolase
MAVIDADTHVDETEATWAGLEGAASRFAPATMGPSDDEIERSHLNPDRSRFWLVEGRLQVRAVRDDIHHPLRTRRELEDLEGRLLDMDEMGVDIQVLFPTFFIRYVSLNAEPEAALARSYNEWVAKACAQTNGRMRWVAVVPWLNAADAIEEIRWDRMGPRVPGDVGVHVGGEREASGQVPEAAIRFHRSGRFLAPVRHLAVGDGGAIGAPS